MNCIDLNVSDEQKCSHCHEGGPEYYCSIFYWEKNAMMYGVKNVLTSYKYYMNNITVIPNYCFYIETVLKRKYPNYEKLLLLL